MQARRQEGEPGTLVVNTIGDRAASQAAVFLTHLKYTGASSELAGVFSNSNKSEVLSKLELATTPVPKRRGFFAGIFGGNQDTNRRNISIKSYADVDLGGFDSNQAQAVAHFISYERDTGRKIKPTLDSFKQALPNALHFGVIAVAPGSPLEKFYFDREVEFAPAESLGIPIILLDQDCPKPPSFRIYERIPAERALMVGIGGLVSNHIVLPDFNRDSYNDLIASLATQSQVIGVHIAQHDTYLDSFGNPSRQEDIINAACRTAGEVIDDQLRFTSLPRKETASLDAVTVQIPIKSNHRIWKEPRFLQELAPYYDRSSGKAEAASEISTAFSYGPQEPLIDPVSKGKTSIIAVRFYAAEYVPSWHLIMKLAEKL